MEHVEINDHEEYSSSKGVILLKVSLSSSTVSIVTVPSVWIWWFTRKTKNIQFHHRLIFILLICDLFKAILLLIFAIHYMATKTSLEIIVRSKFCDSTGFFTALVIEAGDFSTLLLAIHTALVVFCTSRPDGLATYKYSSFFICVIVLPILTASLGFTDNSVYRNLTTWCYMGTRPTWCRLALSWIPRGIVMMVIAAIYLAIYFYVKYQIRELEKTLLQTSTGEIVRNMSLQSGKQKNVELVRNRMKSWLAQFPGMSFLSPLDWRSATITSISPITGSVTDTTDTTTCIPPEWRQHEGLTTHMASFILSENYIRFQRRRSMIEKQIRFLFMYPLVFLVLWIFPLIQEILHFKYSLDNSRFFWISLIADFMKPFSGFVNSMLFISKEQFNLKSQTSRQQGTYLPSTFENSRNEHLWTRNQPIQRNQSTLWNSSFSFGGQKKTSLIEMQTLDISSLTSHSMSPLAMSSRNISPQIGRDRSATLLRSGDNKINIIEFLQQK